MVTENRRMVEVNHEMVEEMRAGRIAQEQPHVIVDLDFKGDLLDLVIRNVGRGIAKDIAFTFSPPLDDIRGISPTPDLSVFKSHLDFLAPGGEIPVFWGISSVVIRALEDRGLAEGITVKIRCSSWAGEEYVYERKISPVLLAVGPIERKDPDDLIVAVEQISRTLSEFLRMHRESP
jgi:hypothetical protein